MKDSRAAVIGAGLVGGGTTQTCAQAEYEVVNIDLYTPALDRARSNIEKLFDRKIVEGTITEGGKAEIMDRLTYSCDFGDVKDIGIVIEAVPEKMEVKKDTFKEVDELVDPDIITVSNTSVSDISEIASTAGRTDKVTGVHFFYPIPVMKLAESIRGIATSSDAYGRVRVFTIDIKGEVADCPELPGFIVNRVLVPMMNEATLLVMEGCKPEGVDKAMKLGANYPMGPLELCNLVGMDIMLTTMIGLHNGFRDSKYRSCPVLESIVEIGHLGRKTRQGFCQCI